MIACVDTHYTDATSHTAVLLFERWADEVALEEYVHKQQQKAAEYVPGEFFLRELPCILNAIKSVKTDIETIVVDGYVQLGEDRAGLGQKLFEVLNEKIAVIGVAKNEFRGTANARQVFRGKSARPLFITAAGIILDDAARSIANMHGCNRIPTLLKRVDYLSRHGST